MEGYSVTEAASVLGVPTERVWELLARGILAGQPQGEAGMRVFLQPRSAPAAAEPASPRINGGEPEPRGELSPFRELLTEFRNLTERYGQALLALGEARGEVAALRSRVDLLEARMDLRLPSGAATSPPIGWTQPAPRPAPGPAEHPEQPEPSPAAPAPEPAAEPGDAQVPSRVAAEVAEAAAEDEADARRGRRGGTGRATESFAEALARAEDPSMPELLGGSESAAAHAAWRHPAATEEVGAPDASLPRELPPADAVPVADEATAEEPRPVVEPTERGEAPGIEAAETSEPEAEPESQSAEVEPEPMPVEGTSEEVPPVPAGAERMPVEAPSDEDAVPAWQDERYTAEIAEPDWWEAEVLPEEPAATLPPSQASEAAPAEGEHERETAVTEAEAAESTEPTPATSRPAPSGRATIGRLRPTTTSRDEETVLWFGRQPAPEAETPSGDADEMEIAPSGLAAAEPMEKAAEEPVMDQPRDARPLDDPLAALEALSQATPRDAGRPDPVGEERRSVDAEPPSPPSPSPMQTSTGGRAYRRLRRIFPG